MAERQRLPKCPVNLKLSSKELGRGAYGAVREGEFNGRPVAVKTCLLYTSPSPRDRQKSRMPSSA